MRSLAIGFGTLVLGLAAQTSFAADTFLMNIPGINGDVTLTHYLRWISVTSFAEAIAAPQSGNSGTGAGVGKLTCRDMKIVKPLDVTSPAIMGAVATGKRYAKIDVVAVKTGESTAEFLHLTLHNVVIASVKFAGDSTDTDPMRTETLTLDPEKIELTFTPQRNDGSVGSPITQTIDCGGGGAA